MSQGEDASLLRLIDANIDRSQEGLRLLEDLARFALDDASLAGALKDLRHLIAGAVRADYLPLLSARRAPDDVAAFLNPPQEMERSHLESLVAANAKRVEESLRTLEETAKLPLPGLTLATKPFKEARFALYDLERRLIDRLLRQDLRARLRGLYVILDPEFARERDLLEVAQLALAGGARILQLRDKAHDKGDQLPLALSLREICNRNDALFIINDHVDLALACSAHGVHLGQTDLPVAAARRMLPIGSIVGCSTRTLEQARTAQAEGADYVAVGVFPSPTKPPVEPFHDRLDTLKAIKEAVSLPVCAISGINAGNIGQVLARGADMAAVISAVVAATGPREAARALAEKFKQS